LAAGWPPAAEPSLAAGWPPAAEPSLVPGRPQAPDRPQAAGQPKAAGRELVVRLAGPRRVPVDQASSSPLACQAMAES
ncbi:MAG TPA: hypothetical protein DEH11_03105, partial [Actinobacteria bacterium]|nr:hypothetical protein [Actinomycetota bacterium]